MLRSKQNKQRHGFTMVEVLLSIALFISISGASAIALYSIDQKTSIDETQTALVATIRRAQLQSIGMLQDAVWGVHIGDGAMTVFQGPTYEERVESRDSSIPIPDNITATGLTDMSFAGVTGWPNVTGDIILSTPYESRTITLATDGAVIYE